MKHHVLLGADAEKVAVTFQVRDLMIAHARSGAENNPMGYAGVYVKEAQIWLGLTMIKGDRPTNWVCVRGPVAIKFSDAAPHLIEALLPGVLGKEVHVTDGAVRADDKN